MKNDNNTNRPVVADPMSVDATPKAAAGETIVGTPAPGKRRMSRRTAIVLGITLVAAGLGATALCWHPWDTVTSASAAQAASTEGKYTCPMHPQVISDKPGVCPICFMDLVPVKDVKAKTRGGDAQALTAAEIAVSDRGRITADVATTTVATRAMSSMIAAAASVDYNEATHRVITARTSGRIERLFVDQTGRSIARGAALMEIYSPELVTAQQEYLVAKQSPALALPTVDSGNGPQERNDRLVAAARKRLELLGMNAGQIAALDKRGEIAYTTMVYATAGGLIIRRGVTEGAYVNPGTLLFELVDLSSVYVIANVPESDAWRIRPGQQMDVSGPSLGGEVLHGRVDFVYPAVDAASRSVRVRAILPNPGGRLKPGMFVTANIAAPQGTAMVVPASSVIRTGRRDIVYVEVTKDTYEAREVRLGIREGDYYQILRGLNLGDRIVVEGGYLIDSESQLQGTGAPDPHAGHGTMTPEEMKNMPANPGSDGQVKP